MRFSATFAAAAAASFASTALGCAEEGHSCYGPQNDVVLTRKVKRMQPESSNATSGPRAPLEWGQLNFLHTTDTHGWLEGHLKEQNYGADWGDYVSFTTAMKAKARELGVDLLLVDTGVSLHKTRPIYVVSLLITYDGRTCTTALVSRMPRTRTG